MSHISTSHMSHILTSHVSHISTSHMSHILIGHATHINESCHPYQRVISRIRKSDVTHINESRHTYIDSRLSARSATRRRTRTPVESYLDPARFKIYVCIHIRIYARTATHGAAHERQRRAISTLLGTIIYMHMCTCIFVYIFMYTCINLHVYKYMYMNICM